MRRHLLSGSFAGAFAGLALLTPAFAQDQAAPAPAAEAAPVAPASVDTVLATVNGTEITLGNVIAMRERLPEQYQGLPDDVLLQGVLDQLIDQALLAAEVSTDPANDPLAVRVHLENERRASLAAGLVQERIARPVDAAAVQAAYDAQVAAFKPAKEYSASHILVATEDEAKAIETELKDGGDFAAIAKEKSTDPGSGAQGGSLGWFGAGQMVPEFQVAVEALQPGQISEPVRSQFGWHIVRLDEVRDTAFPPFEEVKAQMEDQVRQQTLEAEIAALREKATIVKPEAAIAPSAIRQGDLLQN
jgi:peptidyl-prolyl cis-trans isomerase C